MKSKGEAGEHLCTNPPYGYRKDPADKKLWIVDEEAAEVVKQIFSLCLDSYGPSQIARILKADKVITPTVYYQRMGKATRSPLLETTRIIGIRSPLLVFWSVQNIKAIQ